MRTVTLNNFEWAAGVELGLKRMVYSMEAKLNHASTYKRSHLERLSEETIGACGEIAFCKAFNKYFIPSVNTFHNIADVGMDIEVRSTVRDNGSLIVRDNDDDDRWYVLVTGTPPVMKIVGRIRGRDAKKPEYIRNPNDYRVAWFVPQIALEQL